MENKILITGGAGFVGSHLVDYFSKENKVISYDLKQNNNILDFRRLKQAMAGVDYILHLAALVSVPESMQKPLETEETNVKGTLNVLKAAVESDIKKVVFFSSAAVYGNLPDLPKTELSKLDPKSPYALSKISGEYYMKLFSEQHKLDTVSLRCFNIYGSRQNPNSPYAAAVPIFVKQALKEKPLTIYGNGEQTRDFVYVKDVASACELVLDKKTNGAIFNVASGTSTSVNELAGIILKLTDSDSEIIFDEERPGDIKHSYASIVLAKENLDFAPNYSLEQGLKETIKWFGKSKN